MKETQIVKCTQCSGLMLMISEQKTKVCPYCGSHVNLMRAQKVVSSSNVFEASEMLRKLKSERGFNRKQG